MVIIPISVEKVGDNILFNFNAKLYYMGTEEEFNKIDWSDRNSIF